MEIHDVFYLGETHGKSNDSLENLADVFLSGNKNA